MRTCCIMFIRLRNNKQVQTEFYKGPIVLSIFDDLLAGQGLTLLILPFIFTNLYN